MVRIEFGDLRMKLKRPKLEQKKERSSIDGSPINDNQCILCGRTQEDWDKIGREWARKNDAGGYGVPGFIGVHGKPFCDYCARDVTEAFGQVYPDEAKNVWHHHKRKTASRP